MEGVLWVRQARGKLLRNWHKRYFLLTDDGKLKEFASDQPNPSTRPRRSSSASSGSSSPDSGMTLRSELDVSNTAVKTLPFPLVGRHNVFQITSPASEDGDSFRLVLSARQAEDMRRWIAALRAVTLKLTVERPRRSLMSPMGVLSRRESDNSRVSSEGTALESEFLEISMPQRAEMAQLSSVYEWVHDCGVKTSRNLRVAGVTIPRGSLLVSANGVSLQTLAPEEVRKLLLESTGPLPVALRFLRSPTRRGVLRAKLCASPLTQLKSMARYRTTPMRDWKEQVVELSGDLVTCHSKTKTPRGGANSGGFSGGNGGASKTKRVLALSGGSSVKPVHELVAERKFCFLVTVQAHSMLFQARSESDRRAWTDAIQRAITIADGLIPGGALARGSFDLDALQLQSSLNMRHLDQAFEGMDDEITTSYDQDGEESDEDEDRVQSAVPLPSAEAWDSATKSAAYLPDRELSEMLRFLQSNGRFVEALQLMGKNTTLRAAYWRQVFHWALDPALNTTELFQKLVLTPLSDAYVPLTSGYCLDGILILSTASFMVNRDDLQVQKDIPRTAKWLAGSAGAPRLDDIERTARLENLEHVLRAFLSSCSLDVRTDEDPVSPSSAASPPSSPSFYMQGMNGLGFILLEVLEDDEVQAFRFLRGIVARILPHVFGICCDGTGRDHFDLFRSLVEVGDVLQEVARLHLPNFHAALERAGLPVCLLAYKWFPTLFSDVSLTASHSQLRYDTLLGCWDVCLLLGLEGMFCVALALCSAAEDAVLSIGTSGGDAASAEQVSYAVGCALSKISPEDLVTSVCEVLELCSHPVLLKLRNAHRRRLQLGYSKVGNGFAAAGTGAVTATSGRGGSKSNGKAPPPPMTVTDLDSGKVFKISRSGSMLLPTAPPR
ncbi:hypothetical protein BBJ28_00001045 [Nothophytophthora sp. Chile5]|nr:hypothetical protein BBJ28_00001045 [Nothophytophthora sp. Chile5]